MTSRKIRNFLVSLKVTVTLLILGMILIFWATLAQVELGVWGVQERFFHCWIVMERIPGTKLFTIFPGGYLIGWSLFINLVAAHIARFKFTLDKIGIQLTHLGVIMLLLGELFTGLWQESYTMFITEGQTRNYSEHSRNYELAVIDMTDPQFDDVVAIPAKLLEKGEAIQHPKLPFRVVSKGFYPNSNLVKRDDMPSAPPSPANMGSGPAMVVVPVPVTYKDNEANFPTAYVELVGPEGSLGTWVASADLVDPPQDFTYRDHHWKLVMRPQRAYKPFSLTLLEINHDVYPGTTIPKNFSSLVKVKDGTGERDVKIYMNNPMRYAGLTFYQQQMDPGNKMTGLQVVRNPSWRMPYIACIVMTIGLLQQFGAHLLSFIRKRRLSAAP